VLETERSMRIHQRLPATGEDDASDSALGHTAQNDFHLLPTHCTAPMPLRFVFPCRIGTERALVVAVEGRVDLHRYRLSIKRPTRENFRQVIGMPQKLDVC
jgi:hypothetical protein